MSEISDVQRMAAKQEYEKLESERMWPYYVAAFMFAMLGLAALTSLDMEGVLIALFFGFLFWLCLLKINEREKRMTYLRKIMYKKERYSLCPFCKSPSIESEMVHSGSTTTRGVTRISDNINPLHPFTHTNVRPGKTDTREYYRTIYHCLSCGEIFNEPETIYK